MNFLTVSEAAAKLGVYRQIIHYWIKSDQIKATWMLGRWAIPSEEITRIKRERNGRSKAAITAQSV